jgi:hypothetical protein
MEMVEREQAHRISQESTTVAAMIRDTRRGHWMGWSISIGALVGSGVTAYLGAHPSVSIAFVGLPIVALVHAFIRTRRQ